MNTQITASIVTYKHTYKDIKPTIDSFLNTELKVFLYIIDNSPSDKLKTQIPKQENISYTFLNCNKGFGFGHNIILKEKTKLGQYHLILNPDIFIPKGVLEELFYFYEKNPKIGILTPRILFPDNSIQYLPKILPQPINLILRFFPFLSVLFQKQANNYILKNIDYKAPFKIGVVSGCFMLIKTDNLKEKIFDDRFFMYFEDVDLSRQIGINYDLFMYPFTNVYHNYERGAHKNFFLFKTFLVSLIKYFNKWGWIFDSYRKENNKKILNQFNNK